MNKQVSENLTVSSFYLWFVLHGTQTGIAMLNFPGKIILGAERDAWMSILITGLSIHLVVWMIFFVLNHAEQGDIISLHRQLFGKWLGNLLTLGFYGYTLLFISTEIRSYVEVLHVWVFQWSPPWELTCIILLTSIYFVTGGFRVITGICLWCVIIPSLMLITLYFPMKYAHWNNFLPILTHNIADYTESAHRAVPLFLGIEFLLLYYPYIKNNKKAQKWAHVAAAHTTMLYMVFACVVFAYFNIVELKHTIWPTLILSKIIRFPFFERFDYLYVFNWFLIILPRICIALWGGTQMLRKTARLKARPALWLTGILLFIIIVQLKGPLTIDRLDALLASSGTILLYGYIPLLAIWVSIIRLFKRGSLSAGNDSD
ncbi:GerAB/ArcD/ProY family transporter [Paenibacillus sp. MWE-103]|uniref:GerAB/ArcD/ProY family transporter n=1 Tax=Paenibacillus artemisiicola TaxID=1172618 RepID=A0ABS3WEI8_9BACL|nr:GerAB/ArcD/ProY family transporter [Paenibacillus artemisiicola]